MAEINDSIPIKEILTAAGPLIKAMVDTYVVPKLEILKKRFSLDYNKHYVPLEEHFSEYFHRTYKKISIINTLVFNNSQKLLKDIYLPLTIIKRDAHKPRRFKIATFPDNLFAAFDKILLTDNAGMGKSTLIKKLFLEIIDNKKGIPILVELRRLNKEKKIIDEIKEQMNPLEKHFNDALLLELINEGGVIILLDGYDEISLSEREKVTIDIQSFISKASRNKFVLTSRPESALTSFGDFQEFGIEPLKRKEAFELLRKYDKQGVISTLLIKKLEESDMRSMSEFLTNPLLVSLLFTAFQHKQTIPFKKHIFYRQVYDASFDSHDLTKGDSYTHNKYSRLETDDFHRALRHIGFSCLKGNQRIEFTKDEILLLIENAKAFCVNLTFNASDFLRDLLITVPLFMQDGIYYRWIHKSLQEYFAAQFIYLDSKEQQSKILCQLYNNPSLDKFVNILDLYYDIDPKTFRSTILYDYLLQFKTYFDSSFQVKNLEIEQGDLVFRKEITFLNTPFLFTTQLDDKGNAIMQGQNMQEMLKKLELRRVSGRINSSNFTTNLFCLTLSDAKDEISTLLFQKMPNMFDSLPTGETANIYIAHSLKTNYEPYFLNDKKDDEFNSINNFKDINKLIAHSRIKRIKINSREAFRLLAQIENQIQSLNRENFLLDGI